MVAISEKIPVNIIELSFRNIIFLDSEGTSRDKSQVEDVEDSLLGTYAEVLNRSGT